MDPRNAAGYLWTRRGDRVAHWHTPLDVDTTAIFSVVTFREHRRQGIARRALLEVCRQDVPVHGRAVGAGFMWNTASARMFESAGFSQLAMGRPSLGRPE